MDYNTNFDTTSAVPQVSCMTTMDVGVSCLAPSLPQVGFRPIRLWRWLLPIRLDLLLRID